MTQRQRRGLRAGALIGGAVAFLTAAVLLLQPIRLLGRAFLDTPSIGEVQRAINDSIRAHTFSDRPWRDSVAHQVQAIRCNVDGSWRDRHLDECAWRTRP